MSDPYQGQILWVDRSDYEKYPHAYSRCDGRLISIMSQMAVFSMLGTAFGGNGHQTFAVPDLRHVTAPGVSPEPPRSGPPAGTSVPFVDADGKLTTIAIEKMPGAIPAPAPGTKDPILCLCLYGNYPQRA